MMMMITIFYVDKLADPARVRRFVLCKLLVKRRIGREINMNEDRLLSGGATCSQSVPWLRAACSPFEYLLEHVVIAVDVVILLSQRGNGATGVKDCRVVAVAERITDVRKTHLCEVLCQRHCKLPGPGDVATALFRVHVRYLDLVVLGDGLLDVVDRDLPVLCGQEVLECLPGRVESDVPAVEARISDDARQRSFQFAHVRADVLGDEKGDFLRELERHRFGFFQDDRDPHFLLRGLDCHGQAPRKARLEALVHSGKILRIGIAGDDELLVGLDQSIERVKEFFLCAVFPGEKLDVIDQKKIERVIVAFEFIERFLLVGPDDIQFFTGKDRTQEEFFYAFNALIEAHKQLIITCDTYPKDLAGMDERLKSRFSWGLTVAIEPPEQEMRVAIILKKAKAVSLKLSEEVAFFIAMHIRSNVRELEGALKSVIAYSRFNGH